MYKVEHFVRVPVLNKHLYQQKCLQLSIFDAWLMNMMQFVLLRTKCSFLHPNVTRCSISFRNKYFQKALHVLPNRSKSLPYIKFQLSRPDRKRDIGIKKWFGTMCSTLYRWGLIKRPKSTGEHQYQLSLLSCIAWYFLRESKLLMTNITVEP